MNPDNPPRPEEEDARIEKQLRALPGPALPPEWRELILRNAAGSAWPWLSRPVRWGLAACWAATGVIYLTTPPAPALQPQGMAIRPLTLPGDLEKQWLARQESPSPETELIHP